MSTQNTNPNDSLSPGGSPGPGWSSASSRSSFNTWIGFALLSGLLFGLLDGVLAGREVSGTHPMHLGAWLQCLAASVCTYVGLAAVLGLGPLLLSKVLSWKPARLETALWVLVAGAFLFAQLFWRSRTLVFSGRSVLDPRRLAAAGVFLLLAMALGALLSRVFSRLGSTARRTWLAVAAMLGLAGLFVGYINLKPEVRGELNERNRDLPNVLLIVVDALRQDVLEPYGSSHVKTPVIEQLAQRGVVFENTRVQAPFTWTSFGSFLTGKYPRRHGLVKMAPGVRMSPNVTLAWHLKQAAFEDPAKGSLQADDFIAATFMTGALSNGSGLMRGFDFYYEAMQGHELADNEDDWSIFRSALLPSIFKNKIQQRFSESPVADAALKWLGKFGDRRFFAMVHLYSTHTPYIPPKRFADMYCDPNYSGPFEDGFWAFHREAVERGDYELNEADIQQIKDLYYGGTTQADYMIGQVLDGLREQGVLDDTLVIVTSDHGEELGEHGLWEHNHMYETNLHIPLIIAGPGFPEGERVSGLVESVDLVPTVCDALGVVVPDETEALRLRAEADGLSPAEVELAAQRGKVDGLSVMPLVNGEAEQLKTYSFAENGRFLSILSLQEKLIVRRRLLEEPEIWDEFEPDRKQLEVPRYFRLDTDYEEFDNRFGAAKQEAEKLFGTLQDYNQQMPVPLHDVVESVRDEFSETLKALGYVGGIGEGLEDEPAPQKPSKETDESSDSQ